MIMNKDRYKSAMDKIRASDNLKRRIVSLIDSPVVENKNHSGRKLIVIFTSVVLLASITFKFLPSLLNGTNDIGGKEQGHEDEYYISEENGHMEGDYIAVVYLDGYAYEPQSWFSYSHNGEVEIQGVIKGDKLGEVTLDLRGKKLVGLPPDFSSTYNVGSKIYTIKGIKKESTILVERENMGQVFYRQRKAVGDLDQPINLTMNQVFKMISDNPIISRVELRSEEDGSWMRTSSEEKLLYLFNDELANSEIKNYNEIKIDAYKRDHRIPINLVFKDGSMLHMQVYPDENLASVFGGYIEISKDLAREVESLYKKGDEYTRITKLIPYDEEDIGYLYIKDYKSDQEAVLKEPKWSGGALYWVLSYYQVDIMDENIESKLIFSASIGTSKDEKTDLEFHEMADGEVYLKINNVSYKIMKGQLTYKDIREYIKNYTGLEE